MEHRRRIEKPLLHALLIAPAIAPIALAVAALASTLHRHSGFENALGLAVMGMVVTYGCTFFVGLPLVRLLYFVRINIVNASVIGAFAGLIVLIFVSWGGTGVIRFANSARPPDFPSFLEFIKILLNPVAPGAQNRFVPEIVQLAADLFPKCVLVGAFTGASCAILSGRWKSVYLKVIGGLLALIFVVIVTPDTTRFLKRGSPRTESTAPSKRWSATSSWPNKPGVRFR